MTIGSGAAVTIGGNFYLTPANANVLGATYITGGTLTVAGNAQDARDSYYHVYQTGGVVTLGQLLASQGFPGSVNNGGSSYTSYYDLDGGLLTVGNISGGNATSFSRAIDLNLGGGTLAASQGFTLNSNGIVLTGLNSNATINTNGFNVTVPSVISGPGGLVKTGSGMLALTSSGNSYTGGTDVNSGVLQLGSAAALGTGALTVNSAGTLDLQGNSPSVPTLAGSGTILNSTGASAILTVTNGGAFGGTISDGGSETGLTVTGGLLTLSGSNYYSDGTLVSSGTLFLEGAASLLAGTSLTIGSINDGSVVVPQIVSNAGSAALAPVPEPGTLGLLVAGAALLASVRCRASGKKGI